MKERVCAHCGCRFRSDESGFCSAACEDDATLALLHDGCPDHPCRECTEVEMERAERLYEDGDLR